MEANLDTPTLPAGAGLAPSTIAAAAASALCAADLCAGIYDGDGIVAFFSPPSAASGNGVDAATLLPAGAVFDNNVASATGEAASALVEDARGATVHAASEPGSRFDPTDAFFTVPDMFFPSAADFWCMQQLFTITETKACVSFVRATLTMVPVVLLHQFGSACRSFLHCKLPW